MDSIPVSAGKGLATEAVGALLAAALSDWGFLQVVAKTDAANESSRTLGERLGMNLVATTLTTNGRGVVEFTSAVSAWAD